MEPSIDSLNNLEREARRLLLERCCGAHRWVSDMLAQHPYRAWSQVRPAADDIWWNLSAADWREAFAHHPKIGDLDSLRAKFASTQAWAAGEQSQVQEATESVLQGLARGNEAYEAKFGYIFIVCATGKSAEVMLSLLQERLTHDPQTELRVAAEQQRQIMQLRLDKARQEL